MRISQLIEKLQALQAEHGDLGVVSLNTYLDGPDVAPVSPQVTTAGEFNALEGSWRDWSPEEMPPVCKKPARCTNGCTCPPRSDMKVVWL